jgi:hypothetical protein
LRGKYERLRVRDAGTGMTPDTMPKMVGTSLAKECTQIRSDRPIIICTGYSEKVNEEGDVPQTVKKIAIKPLGRIQSAELIREVLEEKTNPEAS